MKYFLGLSSTYSGMDTLRHTFATGSELDLSTLRAYLAAHYGSTFDHTAVYQNGRTALAVGLKAVAPRGSKVIITSLTCYTVTQAVKAAGCIPIYADIDPKTLHFGKKELEKALEGEKDVRAVIVQNNLGVPADIAGIEEVCNKHKLAIVEDLAHCAGIRYADGREAGTVGRVVALSFGKGKSIDAVTGGAVVFTNPLDPPVIQPVISPLFKDSFRARIYPLICAITRGLYHIHPKIARGYLALHLKIHAIKLAADGEVDPKTRLSYWQCKLALHQLQIMPHRGRKPLRDFYFVNSREQLLAELERHGYYFRDIWYNIPVSPERYFQKSGFHEESCPEAKRAAETLVNVPTWYSKTEMAPAIRIIREYLVDKDSVPEPPEPKNKLKKEKKKKAKKEKPVKPKKPTKKELKQQKEKQKEKEEVAALDQMSNIFDLRDQKVAAEKAKEEETVKALAEPSEKPAEKAAEKTAAQPAAKAPEKSTPEEPAAKPAEKPQTDEPKGPAGTDSMTGMRVAPEKLTEREKLKRKLESEGSARSVF